MERDGAERSAYPGDRERRRWIMVVDDNALLRVELGELLKQQGWFVTLCEDGPSAIQSAVKWDFDVALVDFSLPGIRGAVVTETIRLLNPGACIIGISLQDRREEFLAAGADAFLLKPFEIDEVERIAERAGRSN